MVLRRNFFQRDTVIVAKDLLGKKLVRRIGNKKCIGIITETEAYRASDDPASHAAIKKTKRNSKMFEQVGYAYVYFTYGMYHCINVVARNEKFNAGAVLIRGIHPMQGIDIMKRNRNETKIDNLVNGPGKLTQALNISIKENGCDLTKYSSLYITNGIEIKKIHKKYRIGISKGIMKKWNFSIEENDYF